MTSVVTTTGVTVAPSASSVTYGTQVTFTANVTATTGSAAPTGSVDFYDTTTHTDLGLGTSAGAAGAVATWTFTTGVKTFNVTAGDTITASFTPGTGSTWEAASSNSVVEVVTAAAITVTAAIQTKTYDGGTSATALPTITGGSLVSGDSASFSEVYGLKNAGSETLIPTGVISDGNSGNNYSVTYTNSVGLDLVLGDHRDGGQPDQDLRRHDHGHGRADRHQHARPGLRRFGHLERKLRRQERRRRVARRRG